MASKPRPFIYIAYWAAGNLVKIGRSARPDGRLRAYRAQLGRNCLLIAKWPSEPREEQALHRKFKGYSVGNEWFRCEGDLKAFVYGRHP